MYKYGIILLSYFSFLSLSFASADFLGTYRCKGFDPYLQKTYSGTVVVTAQNTVYRIKMNYDTGESARATGGQWNPSLMSVVFQDKEDLKKIGLEQYEFNKEKTIMQGYWVYLGKDKLGQEQCEKISP